MVKKNNYSELHYRIVLTLITFLSISDGIFAQVGVNILTPHSSAAMQIESPAGTTKGLLTPSMTTIQRMSITTGTNVAADGLVVYDKDHRMHYYYNAGINRWTSLSPLTLSTPTVGSTSFPSGVITTPSSSATFSMGINKQNPSQALDVAGNATVSGNVSAGGNASVTGNMNISGSLTVPGFPVNALVPSGIIVMWSGTVVPVGWGLCDGGTYNGIVTPDLRGKFIVGVNNYPGTMNFAGQHLVYGITGTTPAIAPNDGTTLNYGTIGNTGGETGHTLSSSESGLPAHSHTSPPHGHGTSGGVFSTSSAGVTLFALGGSSCCQNYTSPSFASTAVTIDPVSAQNAASIHENRPPYYVLAYIIKL